MVNARLFKMRFLIRLFCLVFAVSLATASPVVADHSAPPPGVDLSQYALPDGTFPVICFGDGESSTTDALHCDECVSTTIAATPSNGSVLFRPTGSGLAVLLPAQLPGKGKAQQHGNPARAPPHSEQNTV